MAVKYICDKEGCGNEVPPGIGEEIRITVPGFPNLYVARTGHNSSWSPTIRHPVLCAECWKLLCTIIKVEIAR